MNAVTEVMDELRKALAELEDCRARNADLRTMLEQVTRDRDHVEESLVRLETQRDEARTSCPDCAMWAERSARWHDDMQRAERERDEARAEVERVRKHYAASVLEHGKMLVEAVDSAKRQKSLADRAHDQACRLAAKLDARSADQFRRGAEAMRKRCEELVKHNSHEDGIGMGSQRIESAIRALSFPEES